MPTKVLVFFLGGGGFGRRGGGEFQFLFSAREDFPEIPELLVLTLDM